MRLTQMAGLAFYGRQGLLVLGPGSLKAGQEAKQSLATLTTCPLRLGHWQHLSTHGAAPQRVRRCW